MSDKQMNFNKYPNNEVSKMSESNISFPNDAENYLKQVKIVLNEIVSGFNKMQQYEKYLDCDFIRIACDECQFSLDQVQEIDLTKPADVAHLISISANLMALRNLIIMKI